MNETAKTQYAIGAVFIVVGLRLFMQLDSWIAPTPMVVGGVAFLVQGYVRQRRGSGPKDE